MKKELIYLLITGILIACNDTPTPPPGPDLNVDLPPTVIDTVVKKADTTIIKDREKELFQQSPFKDVGCATDFWYEKAGPECCCDEILQMYKEMRQNMSKARRANLKAFDPLMGKCRKKDDKFDVKLGEIDNPPQPKESGKKDRRI